MAIVVDTEEIVGSVMSDSLEFVMVGELVTVALDIAHQLKDTKGVTGLGDLATD